MGRLLIILHHIIPQTVSVLLLTQIRGLVVVGDLRNLETSSSESLEHIVVIKPLLHSTCDRSLLKGLGESGLLGTSAAKTNTIDDGEGVNHRLDTLETSGGKDLHLSLQTLANLLSLHEEVVLSLAVLVLDVSESKLLVVTTGKLQEVNLGLLELGGKGSGVLSLDTTGCVLDGVGLDTDDELGADTALDLGDDLEDESHAVLTAASVIVGALVGARRKELSQKVTVGSVKLNTVEASLFQEFGSMGKAVDNSSDVFLDLGNQEVAVLLRLGGQLLVRLKARTLEAFLGGNGKVAGGFEVHAVDDNIAGQD
ncbi:hypothetical protein HG530_001158 [Fusarium avenaceum]|nr:hypothetical protein HG530_001158 [Fusarium avenaceum]